MQQLINDIIEAVDDSIDLETGEVSKTLLEINIRAVLEDQVI